VSVRSVPWAQLLIAVATLVGGGLLSAATAGAAVNIFRGPSGQWWQALASAALLAIGVLIFVLARVEGVDADADATGGGRLVIWAQALPSLLAADLADACRSCCCCERPSALADRRARRSAGGARFDGVTALALRASPESVGVPGGQSVASQGGCDVTWSRAVAVSLPLTELVVVGVSPVLATAESDAEAGAGAPGGGRAWRLRLTLRGGVSVLGPSSRSMDAVSRWKDRLDGAKRVAQAEAGAAAAAASRAEGAGGHGTQPDAVDDDGLHIGGIEDEDEEEEEEGAWGRGGAGGEGATAPSLSARSDASAAASAAAASDSTSSRR